jgi:hypothetical protein
VGNSAWIKVKAEYITHKIKGWQEFAEDRAKWCGLYVIKSIAPVALAPAVLTIPDLGSAPGQPQRLSPRLMSSAVAPGAGLSIVFHTGLLKAFLAHRIRRLTYLRQRKDQIE